MPNEKASGYKRFPLNRYLFCYCVLIVVFGVLYWLIGSGVKGVGGAIDAFYFSVVTASTLGYGDIVPVSGVAKFVAGIQVLVSVVLIGVFLNSLSFAQSELIRQNEARANFSRKQELRSGLDRHASLLIEALKTSNPFIWDKHAIHCQPLATYAEYIALLQNEINLQRIKLDPLRIKIFLECCSQMYDSYTALLSVSAEVSPEHLMRWSSFLSNVRNLKGQYQSVIDTQECGCYEWPGVDDIWIQLEELLASVVFISEPLIYLDTKYPRG